MQVFCSLQPLLIATCTTARAVLVTCPSTILVDRDCEWNPFIPCITMWRLPCTRAAPSLYQQSTCWQHHGAHLAQVRPAPLQHQLCVCCGASLRTHTLMKHARTHLHTCAHARSNTRAPLLLVQVQEQARQAPLFWKLVLSTGVYPQHGSSSSSAAQAAPQRTCAPAPHPISSLQVSAALLGA